MFYLEEQTWVLLRGLQTAAVRAICGLALAAIHTVGCVPEQSAASLPCSRDSHSIYISLYDEDECGVAVEAARSGSFRCLLLACSGIQQTFIAAAQKQSPSLWWRAVHNTNSACDVLLITIDLLPVWYNIACLKPPIHHHCLTSEGKRQLCLCQMP